MPSKKKQVRAVVRRFARLVIENHYRSEGIVRPKRVINEMVKAVERSAVPPLVVAVKSENRATLSDEAELTEKAEQEHSLALPVK